MDADFPLEIQRGADLLKALYERLPVMLADHGKQDAGFRRRCYRRWRDGLDQLKMFIVMRKEYGSTFNQRERPRAVREQSYTFEATVALHARAIRVSNEILALLCEGFPDGALSRWRTLHEIAVAATFSRTMTAKSLSGSSHIGGSSTPRRSSSTSSSCRART